MIPGLLSNYAFPEEGTTLRSVIYRRLSKPIELEDGKTSNYDSKVFEYARPAHAALSEHAPESGLPPVSLTLHGLILRPFQIVLV